MQANLYIDGIYWKSLKGVDEDRRVVFAPLDDSPYVFEFERKTQETEDFNFKGMYYKA